MKGATHFISQSGTIENHKLDNEKFDWYDTVDEVAPIQYLEDNFENTARFWFHTTKWVWKIKYKNPCPLLQKAFLDKWLKKKCQCYTPVVNSVGFNAIHVQ